jgi:pilus assembly protein CpaB
MNRRLLFALLLVVVLVGGAIAFVLVGNPPAPTQDPNNGGTGGGGGDVVNTEPTAIPLPTTTPIPYINIIVAVQEIPRGTVFTPDALAVVPWAESAVPFGAFVVDDAQNADLVADAYSNVVGKIARTDIFIEQPIISTLLVEDFTRLANVGSDAAAVLPSNRVAVALPMDRITSVAYAIQPGDHVDVIVSMLFVDVDRNYQSIEPNRMSLLSTDAEGNITGTAGQAIEGEPIPIILGSSTEPKFGIVSPSEAPRPRLAAQRTIQDAVVVWTGDFPIDGRIFRPAPTPTPIPSPTPEGFQEDEAEGPPPPTPIPPRPDIVTLAVAPQDAVVLTWLVEAKIPITFALRSASATQLVQTDTVSLDYIMQRFRIEVPEKFDYNIEPAIRSIRQLSVGSSITLGNAGGA